MTIDASNGQGVYVSATLTGNVTLSPTNIPGTGPCILEWRTTQHASSAKTITFSQTPENETASTITPATGKRVSVFFEWLAGSSLKIWTSVQK